MSWRMDRDGAAIFEAMSPDDIANRDEEIQYLEDKQRPWKLINGLIEGAAAANQRAWKSVFNDLQAEGVPTALAGGFAGLESTPASGTIATATILTTEVAMWTAATYTPIAANPQCPKAFILRSFGLSTTPASQGTMAFNMRMGQLITSPLLAASVATAQTASQTTTTFRLEGDVLIRRGGSATNGAAVGAFRYSQGTATTGGSLEIAALNQIFGSTAEVAVQTDAGLANALWAGAIATTSTTSTYVPLGIVWASWN